MAMPHNKEFLCQVVAGSCDPDQRGAVRAKVLGVTDSWADNEQPYIYPDLNGGIQQVPQVGYILRVKFLNDDINCGRYMGMSQTPNLLPAAYYDNYPDVAVGNCGEDGFFYEHNRKTHITTITNPGNNSMMTWDEAGYVTYESSIAHTNAGMNASSGGGANVQRVLTEATIDIFTCMPVGSGDAIKQGSEYLKVSHVAQATIDAFHGSVNATPATDPVPSVPQTESDIPTVEIIDEKKEVQRTVQLDRTEKMVKRNGKTIKKILVCHTEGECFPVMAKKFMETTTNAHFLVGKVDGDPEILADNGDKNRLKNSGFYQFIDLGDDCGAYSSSTIDGDKANVDSVVIMLVGSATSNFTSFQREIVDKLVVHIRTKAENKDIPVYTPDSFDIPLPSAIMPTFAVNGY